MTLKIRVDDPSAFAGAVLPHVPTEQELLQSLPGFLGYFNAADRGASGTVWNARYGGIAFSGAPAQGERDGLPVVAMVDGVSTLTMTGFTGFAAMPGVTLALKLHMPLIAQTNKALWRWSTAAGNPQFTISQGSGAGDTWSYRNTGNIAVNRTVPSGPRWMTPIVAKHGTEPMRSRFGLADAWSAQEAAGTALGATNWILGGAGGNGVPAMQINKVICLQSGQLTEDHIATIAEIFA